VYLFFKLFLKILLWLVIIEIQYSGTNLLLLVNPRIPHWNNGTVHPAYVFIIWKGDALLPATTVRIKNCLKRTSEIKVATMKITDDLMEAIMCLPQNQHFLWRAKMNRTLRSALVSPWRMHCMYSSVIKGWSNVEQWKIKPIALAIVELCESEGIRQATS